ncbi:MAG: hypothetical protein COB36_10090, partial [Alphaproteobacteria bacterium]
MKSKPIVAIVATAATVNINLLSALLLFAANPLHAAELEHADQSVEEIIVTSTLHKSRADTALPVNILAGEELREKVATTLGET